MYHIKSDKRCIKSAKTIVIALEQLMLKKPFLDITVTDIQKTAGIGRSTFYRHFDTIDDVVEYSVDETFKEIVADYFNMTHHDFVLQVVKSIIAKGEVMMNLMSSGRAEIVSRSFRNNLIKMSDCTGNGEPGSLKEREMKLQYDFDVFAATCISVINTWDENGRIESIDELAKIVEHYAKFPE